MNKGIIAGLILVITTLTGCNLPVKPVPANALTQQIPLHIDPVFAGWHGWNLLEKERSFENSIPLWYSEALRRFDKPYIFVAHGLCPDNDPTPKTWDLVGNGYDSEVNEMATKLSEAMPDRQIILIVCNEAKHQLNLPNVYYAKTAVWSFPFGYWNREPTDLDRQKAGSIWDFQQGN